MCGIIGYTGTKQAAPVLLGGLKRLEYRGYDSSGIATVKDGKILTAKAKGKIAILDEKISGGTKLGGTVGIGHTRWATHGVPNEANAHPHRSADGRFAVVHNGIIENFFDIKSELTALGYAFASDTDTETVAMLLQHLYRGDGDVLSTICALQKRLCGSYAIGIVCADTPDVLYAVRKDNPLVVGLGNGENFIASDVTAALEHTHDFVLLGDGETARITPDHAEFFDADGKPVKKQTTHIDWDIGSAEKSGAPKNRVMRILCSKRYSTNRKRSPTRSVHAFTATKSYLMTSISTANTLILFPPSTSSVADLRTTRV